MNKLLNVLASAVGCLVAAMFTVACSSEDDQVMKFDFDIKGKVFVNSYFETENGIHEAGTEILEFKTNDSVVRYNLFCFLAGDYLQFYDYEERGRYGVVENSVMIGLGDSMTTAKIFYNTENVPVINWPGLGDYICSNLSVTANKKDFESAHSHELLDPVVKLADSLLTVVKGERYIASIGKRSFVFDVDSVSGSHATNNQTVKFRISNIPGEFVMSEATGYTYLMKFGTMAYAPVDKETAESDPDNIVVILNCDGNTPDCTLVSPSVDKNFKGNLVTKFAKLNPRLY